MQLFGNSGWWFCRFVLILTASTTDTATSTAPAAGLLLLLLLLRLLQYYRTTLQLPLQLPLLLSLLLLLLLLLFRQAHFFIKARLQREKESDSSAWIRCVVVGVDCRLSQAASSLWKEADSVVQAATWLEAVAFEIFVMAVETFLQPCVSKLDLPRVFGFYSVVVQLVAKSSVQKGDGRGC